MALFDAAPKKRPPAHGFQWEEADPLTTFDLKRFNAVRGYQAQQGREISRCLKELRALRKDSLAECTDEPEDTAENKPESPQPPANDDAHEQAETAMLAAQEVSRNEPEPAAAGDLWEVDGVPLLDVWGQPRRHPLAAAPAAGGGAAADGGAPRLAG